MAKDKIDFETDAVYLLEIKITDSGDSMRKRLSDTASMTVYVMDINDFLTPFGSNRVRYVPERSPGGVTVGDAVKALDRDNAQSIRYTMKQLNLADSDNVLVHIVTRA